MLYDWINPVYLKPEVQGQIQEKFESDSEIELKGFLKVLKLSIQDYYFLYSFVVFGNIQINYLDKYFKIFILEITTSMFIQNMNINIFIEECF